MSSQTHRYWPWVLLLGLLLGLAFQGSRGIWDPDEGRYTNVALQMLDSGDWLVPRRHPETMHLTKPPATYWAVAGSASVFGVSEWSLRLPNALAYALTVLLCFGMGRRLLPERPWLPALIYASSPLPFLAANLVTTDTLLAAAEALAMWCYVEACFGATSARARGRWMVGMWAAFGLAFMVKGPPGLLPLLAVVASQYAERHDPELPRLLNPLGLVAFLFIGLGWYLYAILHIPGLLDYFVGHEIAARISSPTLQRFPQWWGPLYVYLPTLLLGAIPWLYWSGLQAGGWLRRWPQLSGLRRQWQSLSRETRLLWLWLLLPLTVFVLARSRLPLYLLPLFVPLTLLLARTLRDRQISRKAIIGTGIWLLVLLGMKLAVSTYPHRKDGSRLSEEILAVIGTWPSELVFIDDYTRYALASYCHCRIEKVTLDTLARPKPVSEADFDDDFAHEITQQEGTRLFIMRPSRVEHFGLVASQHGRRIVAVGGYRDRVIYRLEESQQ